MIKSIFRRKTSKYTHSAIGCNIPEENRSNRSSGNRVTRLGQIRYRKKPKLSSKATGVKIKLARIFKSLRYCLAKKKKGLIHSLVKSVTKSQILKNLCQCLTARANLTCYVAWATGQRDLPTMPDCKGQRNMLRRVGNRAAWQKTRQIYGVSALAYAT